MSNPDLVVGDLDELVHFDRVAHWKARLVMHLARWT
jgi:hypothetical protein